MGLFISVVVNLLPDDEPAISVQETHSLNSRILVTLIGLPYIWFGYRIIKRNIPKGFDVFNEEF